MKFTTAIALIGVLSGCATSGRSVDCSWRLRPINAPAAPKAKVAAPLESKSPTEHRPEAPAP